jgi:hypothetical protein
MTVCFNKSKIQPVVFAKFSSSQTVLLREYLLAPVVKQQFIEIF